MSIGKNVETNVIKFFDDGVYIVEKTGIKKRIADRIKVTAFGTSDPGTVRELAYTAVKFVDREGKRKKETVPSSMLVSQPGEFVALLAGRGYLWPPSQALRNKIVGELSIVKPARRIRVTPVPGCHGDCYVLRDESYTPSGPDRRRFYLCYNPTVRLGEFLRLGTLREWKKYVAKSCVHSSRARLAVAAVFAAPNLRLVEHQQLWFQFQRDDVERKAFCVRLAASAAGLNSSEGPTTWDGSVAGFEQRALGHRDEIVLFDDMSRLLNQSWPSWLRFDWLTTDPRLKLGSTSPRITSLIWIGG